MNILLILLAFISLSLINGVTWAATLTVGSGGSYSTISQAVNAASNSDIISIKTEFTLEQIKMSKRGLKFIGESKSRVIWTSMKKQQDLLSKKFLVVIQRYTSDKLIWALHRAPLKGIVDDKYTGGIQKSRTFSLMLIQSPGTFIAQGCNICIHLTKILQTYIHSGTRRNHTAE